MEAITPFWQNPQGYIDNSPFFWADRVKTPLLIMHNQRDGLVNIGQGRSGSMA